MFEYGPKTPFGKMIHATKYRSPGETFRESQTRVANTLSDDSKHFNALRNILLSQRFLPAGRIQAAVGSSRNITPYNCFVSGTIEDSFVFGNGSIMDRAKEAAATMRLGGGIGYDFSTLRPRKSLIKKLGSFTSGPISFMDIFDAVCKATSSSGHRRGAQMGVLRVDHPDIEEFINAKQNLSRLRHFNVSVAITDEFMRAVQADTDFNLIFDGQIYKTVKARQLWDLLMRSTYDFAEPGVLFIDHINNMNNLWYCETIAATNPCGEQPLPPYGACLLGSFNLTSYLEQDPSSNNWRFNYTKFFQDISVVVRAMDNVIDRAIYPLYEQEKEAISKRRMGIGVTGTANAIEAMGCLYGTEGFLSNLAILLRGLRDEVYRTSVKLAQEKGAFLAFCRDKYLQSKFIKTLPEDIQESIYRHGIRNSHLLSIAPTGTISLAADNISSGIEPVFDYAVERSVIEFDGPKQYRIEDYGLTKLGVRGKKTSDCSIRDHLKVLGVASKYVDSAVSKTCNVPHDIEYEDFKNVYQTAWKYGAKGCTTFRPGGKLEGILSSSSSPPVTTIEQSTLESLSCSADPITGVRQCE